MVRSRNRWYSRRDLDPHIWRCRTLLSAGDEPLCERRSRLLRLNRTPPCIDFAGSPQHGPPHRPRGIPAGATEEAAPGWGEHLRRRSQAWPGTPTARPNRIHAAGQQDVTRVLAERSSPNRFTFLEAIRLAGSVREEAAPGPSEETQRCSAHGLGPLGERAKPGSIVRAASQRAVSEGSEASACQRLRQLLPPHHLPLGAETIGGPLSGPPVAP